MYVLRRVTRTDTAWLSEVSKQQGRSPYLQGQRSSASQTVAGSSITWNLLKMPKLKMPPGSTA